MKLKGKVALVTGAASGIGRAVAMAIGAEGAKVVLADIDEPRARQAAQEIATCGGSAMAYRVDLAKPAQIHRMFRTVKSRYKTVDILVNNAGFQHVAPIAEFDEQMWDTMLRVHLTATFMCSKLALPLMIAAGSGRIINMSSIHGKMGSKFKSAYVAAKHGVIGFTRVLALEAAEHAITANAICPGYVKTQSLERQIPSLAKQHKMSEKEVVERVMLRDVPIKRLLEPEEVAKLVVYLVSDDASGITGESINISCGWNMS